MDIVGNATKKYRGKRWAGNIIWGIISIEILYLSFGLNEVSYKVRIDRREETLQD